MRIAFILFDGMTTLDLAGFHNAVTWLQKRSILTDLSWDLCANKQQISDDRGMLITVDRVLPELAGYDLIFVPGGQATRQLIHDSGFMAWIQTAEEVTYKASVCTGALVLGAAGLTKDRTITSNPLALELLRPYCKEVVQVRAMRDGNLFTGGGITASVDLGLFFIESITNKEIVREIQRYMDYPHYDHSLIEGLGTTLTTVEQRLDQLGIVLPVSSNPAARYTNVAIVNGLAFVSGKGPPGNPKGKLGQHLTTEEGYQYAKLTALEVLAVLQTELGSLDKVKRVVKVQGFVNADPQFEQHHIVLNGFSDLMIEVFGELRGSHARSVLGAASVRDNLPLIVDSIFEINQ